MAIIDQFCGWIVVWRAYFIAIGNSFHRVSLYLQKIQKFKFQAVHCSQYCRHICVVFGF